MEKYTSIRLKVKLVSLKSYVVLAAAISRRIIFRMLLMSA